VVALLMLIMSMRLRGRPGQLAPQPAQPFRTMQSVRTPAQPDPQTNDVVRTELLKMLANLHASGALTDTEFDDQKRRILGG
jgi:hypothetical protein